MRTVRHTVTVAVLGVLLSGCTSTGPTGSEPSGTAGVPSSGPSAASPQEPGTAPPADDDAPRARQPLVLVAHATTPAPTELSAREARRVVRRGFSGRPVLAAPGLLTGPDVPVAGSARAVVREVERRPELVGIVPATAVGPTVRPLPVSGIDPMRQPRRYPLTTPGPRAPRPTSLTVVGDIMLTRGVTDPRGALQPMSRRLRSADITVANLESTLSTDGPPRQGTDSFAADEGVVGWLRGLVELDAVSLANNHTGDFGDAALLTTVRKLQESALRPFGAGKDLAAAGRPAIVERNGTRFGFLGFNAIGETPRAAPRTPGALSVRMPPRTGPLQEADLRHVTGLVTRLDRRVDVVVVLPHWGTQYTHEPEPVQRTVSRRLVEAGADLVVGGHPHWVQGIDVHDGVLVAHSLGNFVFDMDFMVETQQGVVLEATYWGDEVKSFDLVPYRMDASFAPRPAGPGEAADILGDVWSTSTGPFRER